MKHFAITLLALFLVAMALRSADPAPPQVNTILDRQLSSMEREVVSLAEAMPAEKYGFAPTSGEFSNVRTFALQVRHIATVIYECAAGVRGEKPPVELGTNENGAATLESKDQIVKYLKDSMAYAHKSMAQLTSSNLTDAMPSPFEPNGKMSRLGLATIPVWHSYDHYGQMVVYARLNGIVPPASRPQ